MKALLEKALAGVRWVWERFVPLAKSAWAWIVKTGNTLVDPPPVAYKWVVLFGLWCCLSVAVVFSFVNSWFYPPTVSYLSSMFEDGDVFIPDHIEPLPSVATPAVSVPSVEVVCHDMSDTPQCEPVYESAEKRSQGTQTEAEVNQPVAKPKSVRAKNAHTRRKVSKHQPYVTYWGY